PSARAEHTMVWDPDGAQVILYGGHDPSGMTKVMSDVWAWDGEDWSALPSEGGPGALHVHAATWHAGLGRMVVFGGFTEPGYPQKEKNPELWSYNPQGGQWQQHEDAPVGVAGSQLAYDGVRDRLVMFGGRAGALGSSYPETYEWDGAQWATLVKPVWYGVVGPPRGRLSLRWVLLAGE
ncbi:MAG: Kelch repeat-containing protein, partial [Nannocystaceae bacterium]